MKFAGSLGLDQNGDEILSALRDHGVSTDQVRRAPDVATGSAIILVDAEGENSIIIDSGANARMVIDEHCQGVLQGVGVLLVQLEIPIEAVVNIVRIARESGILTVVNAAPVPVTRPQDLRNLLAHTDILVVNEIEAAQILQSTGLPFSTPPTEDEIAAVTTLGPRSVVTTLGACGVLVVGPEGSTRRVNGIRIAARDTTGAGDAFCAGMVASLVREDDLDGAVAWGNACGAYAALSEGAQDSFGRREQVKVFAESARRGAS